MFCLEKKGVYSDVLLVISNGLACHGACPVSGTHGMQFLKLREWENTFLISDFLVGTRSRTNCGNPFRMIEKDTCTIGGADI